MPSPSTYGKRKDPLYTGIVEPSFCTLRQTLLGQISDVGFDIANMTTKDLCYLLLYGKPNGSTLINRMILEATISFIKSSKRFE